jgi:hypothetical protein
MNVVMDMETMISYLEIDTEDKEQSLKDLAKTYQRSIMRKHTKGIVPFFLRLRRMKPIGGRRGFHFSLHQLGAEEVV